MLAPALLLLLTLALACSAAAAPLPPARLIGSGDPDVFMYVSFRGETGSDEPTPINNLQSFDSTGALICKDVLNKPASSITMDELRGVAIYPIGSDRYGQLVVANAHKTDSAVLRYSATTSKIAGHRDYMDELLVRNKENPALIHPYSIVFATFNSPIIPRRVFVASQDNSCVLAYNADSGAPMSVGSHWHSLYPNASFDAGMLVPSMSEVGFQNGGLSSPRSMAIGLQRGQLFVVDSAGDCVRGYDIVTGAFLGDVWCGTAPSSPRRDKGTDPVGLVLLHNSSTLVVTLEADNTLIAVDVSQWPVQPAPAPVTLLTGFDHPAGVSLSCDGHFYIANRKDRSIIKSKAPSRAQLFSSSPSTYQAAKVSKLDVFISGLTDEPEQVLLLDSELAGTCMM